MSQQLRAAILIVSTTVAQGSTTDATESILRSVFEADGSGQWSVFDVKAVEDSALHIQRQVIEWTDNAGVNLVVTTGGTGFAVSDHTPEVCP